MASPQLEKGYTPIANEILEQLVQLPLNGTQWRIVFTVLRYTYGFQRKSHDMSISFLANALVCNRNQVKRELDKLVEQNILTVDREASFSKSRIISFNKNYDEYKSDHSTLIRVLPSNRHTREDSNQSTPSTQFRVPRNKTINKKEINALPADSVNEFFDSVWEQYPNKKGKSKIKYSQMRKLHGIGIDELERAIGRYKSMLKKEDWRKPQDGSTFFNGTYTEYLDSSIQPDDAQDNQPVAWNGKIT